MTYDPKYEVRQIQRGIRHVSGLYGLGYRLIIDSIAGPETGRDLAGTLHYMGFSDPLVRKGFNPGAHTIAGYDSHIFLDPDKGWLFHPSNFYLRHPWAYTQHRRNLAKLRALRLTQWSLPMFDGLAVMPAVWRDLTSLRNNGWNGTISTDLGGCRTAAQQQYLWDHERFNEVVAQPGTSEHECYRFARTERRGAADLTDYDNARAISDKLGLGLKNNVAGDPVHFDFIH